nr:hypothetical protein BaRGS_011350 [Batillaria attramentaria]
MMGIVKPDIVFFGEELPKRFYYYLKDMLLTDLVLVMGTSLEVQPFAGIIDTVRFTVPRVLFNRMAVGPFRKQKRPKDFVSEGDLIGQMQEFVEMTGWTQDMVNLITRMEGYFRTVVWASLPSRQLCLSAIENHQLRPTDRHTNHDASNSSSLLALTPSSHGPTV